VLDGLGVKLLAEHVAGRPPAAELRGPHRQLSDRGSEAGSLGLSPTCMRRRATLLGAIASQSSYRACIRGSVKIMRTMLRSVRAMRSTSPRNAAASAFEREPVEALPDDEGGGVGVRVEEPLDLRPHRKLGSVWQGCDGRPAGRGHRSQNRFRRCQSAMLDPGVGVVARHGGGDLFASQTGHTPRPGGRLRGVRGRRG